MKQRVLKHDKPLTKDEIRRFQVVASPAAREVLGDEARVGRRLEAALDDLEAARSNEVVLWQGDGKDRVVGLINPNVKTVYVHRFGGAGDAARDEALRVVARSIGSRPDLPAGKEYVRRVRGVWKGLLPVERS